MESFGLLLILLLILLALAVPIMAIVALVRSSALATRMEEGRREFSDLQADVAGLRNEVGRLSRRVAELEASPAAPRAAAPPASVIAPAAVKEAVPEPKPAPPPSLDSFRPAPPAPAAPPSAPAPAPPAPAFTLPSREPRWAALAQRLKTSLPLEQFLGMNLFARVGIVLLVLGLALLGRIALVAMTPPMRVALSCGIAGALLGGGIWLEGRERYRILGRAGIGGGWALLFFTAYAMAHVGPMTVMRSNTLDCTLMLLAAVAMMAHTLRYRSQLVTGLAFLLGFSTVALSQDTVYALAAGVILALGIAAVALLMNWFELEIFGILASYANHFYWLHKLYPHGAAGQAFPQFWPSSIILVLYWAVFRASYLVRTVSSPRQEALSSVAALANTVLLLGVLKFQATRPGMAFYALLVLGALEFLLGQLPLARRRRTAFQLLTVIGTLLMFAAVPFRFSGNNIGLLWMVAAEVLLIAGILQRETLFRRLGWLAGCVTGTLIVVQARGIASAAGWPGVRLTTVDVLLLFCAALFYSNALYWKGRGGLAEDTGPDTGLWHQLDTGMAAAQSYLGCITAFLGLWSLLIADWTALGWAALLLGAAVGMRYLKDRPLLVQIWALAAAVLLRAVLFNAHLADPHPHHLALRLFTLPLLALAFYALHWILAVDVFEARLVGRISLWAGTGLLALLAWSEFPAPWVAVAWMLFGLALALVDRAARLPESTWQAHVLALLAVIRAAQVNFTFTGKLHGVDVRLLTVALLVAALYALARWVCLPPAQEREGLRHWYSWVATALAAWLIWCELQPISVAPALGVFALLLFEIGVWRRLKPLRFQSYTLLGASFVRIFLINLTAVRVPGEAIGAAVYTVVPLILIYFYVWTRLQGPGYDSELGRWRAGDMVAYLGAGSFVALLYYQLPPQWTIAGWALGAVTLLAAAWGYDQEVFLEQSVLLTTGIAARGLAHNVFGTSYFAGGGWRGNFSVIVLTSAVLLAALPIAFRLRKRCGPRPDAAWLTRHLAARRPDQYLFFVPLLLIVIAIAVKSQAGTVTLAWGAVGLLAILLGLLATERSYRIAGLTLLVLCVGKIVFRDAWHLDERSRYVTFIVLGAALIVVSALYSRYRDQVSRLL